jgi:citrate synthase
MTSSPSTTTPAPGGAESLDEHLGENSERRPAPALATPALATPVSRGLEGVVAAETAVGSVRGLEGFFHYRQYDAAELARKRSFEDVWQLMFDGALPGTDGALPGTDGALPGTGAERCLAEEARPLASLQPVLVDLLKRIVAASAGAPPLDQLRTAVSLLGAMDGMRATRDLSAAEVRRDALRIAAAVPTLATALHRISLGQEPVAPDSRYGTAANYLYTMSGSAPDPRHVGAIERYLISTMDHGLNASTFAARVVTSTGADVAAAVTAAIGALSGPLHGGAPSRALDTLDAIGSPDRAEAYIRAAIESGDRIMGFGHRVYRTLDPRSELMKETARSLGGPLVDLAEQVEATVVRLLAEMKPDRQLYTNVEFFAGVVMELCRIPREMFTPTFAVSRVVGWCAHIIEQAADNRIIRPTSLYVGPPPPEEVPAA